MAKLAESSQGFRHYPEDMNELVVRDRKQWQLQVQPEEFAKQSPVASRQPE
jgi:hypothetical protein